ncbi:MAG: zinc-ribbon domain-containing protein [Casimicrobiaceae bacterium]|nr:zinc-ribbon domain-containing protein [Casimicrobiaceae bacterium]MCX8098242.1 zinc-ribbon domain-containing protein [Casimicrobiaceae bacterium]
MDVLSSFRLNPPLAEGIRRLGFRRWYERELIFSHLYLALALVALAGLLGAVELLSEATLAGKLIYTLFVGICAAVIFFSIQGYLLALSDAESIANQARCPRCSAYGMLELIGQRADVVHVRCRRCGHVWGIQS